MNPWWWARFLDLFDLLWWGFVAVGAVFAATVIGINLRGFKNKPPGM